MNDPKFPIMGTTTPRMLGRVSIMERMWNDLTKATPSNLSIIGPRFVGKSVVMNAIAQQAANDASPYSFVVRWHLGHVSPVSDEEFIAQLCEHLRECLLKTESDMSEYRSYLEEHSFSNLSEVTDVLDDEDLPILMLWDGFDKPLAQGMLTRHLWDQMRTLFYGKKHKIVTATRRPLNELIRSEDAITSPFWNIFDMNPVRIQAFDANECETILEELTGYNFQTGATTELINWTSGYPPLLLGVLNQIIRDNPGGSIGNEIVNQAAKKAFNELSNIVMDLWQDCPAGAQDLYLHLLERGNLSSSKAGKHEVACLIEKGFADESNHKLTASCRMLKEHLQGQVQDTSSMARLFGTWEDYKANIRGLLDRRLALIPRFDDRLYRLVERAVADIPDYPDDCLNNLTGIRDCALQLIWHREFGPERRPSHDLIAYWTEFPHSQHRLIQRMMNSNCWDVPTDPLDQIRLLSLLTGSYKDFSSKAKAVSKDTYVLIDAIHNFRNRVQHPDGQSLHVGVAVAALMACLELLGCLERELES